MTITINLLSVVPHHEYRDKDATDYNRQYNIVLSHKNGFLF